MIKTLNDFLTFAALIFITYYSMKILVGSLFKVKNTNTGNFKKRKEYLLDYLNNEEE